VKGLVERRPIHGRARLRARGSVRCFPGSLCGDWCLRWGAVGCPLPLGAALHLGVHFCRLDCGDRERYPVGPAQFATRGKLTNPDLAVILRRFSALATITMLPSGALLLSAGRREAAVGLCFGALIGTLNVSILARRINRSANERVTQAQRVMQQGMGIRFSLILLASVVVIKTTPAAIPAFMLGLVFTMALAIAVAARAMLASAGGRSHVETIAVGAGPRACPGPGCFHCLLFTPKAGQARGPAPTAPSYLARTGGAPLAPILKRSSHQ